MVYDDGNPVVAGMIYFSNPDYLSRAAIKPDGTYDVGSMKKNDGIPPGKYKVFIVGAIASDVTTSSDRNARKNESGEKTVTVEESTRPLIAAKYTSKDTTPIEIEIPGENVFHVVVERP